MSERSVEYFAGAQTAFLDGRYDTALELCEKAAALAPEDAPTRALAGNACFLMKRMEEAEAWFRGAVELDGNNGEYCFDLGNSLFGQQKLSEALACYARAERLGCSADAMKKIYYLMGLINQLSGKDRDALVNFDRSEALPGANEDQADILLQRIQIYVERGELQEAEECASRLKLLMPGEFKAYQLLFRLYAEQKDLVRAESVLDEAERYCGGAPEIRAELVFDRAMLDCFCAEAEPAQARTHYHGALERLRALEDAEGISEENRCEAWITRAEIHMKLEEYAEAAALARFAEKPDPSSVYAERGRYILLRCCEHEQDYETERSLAKRMQQSESVFYRHLGYYAEAYAAKRLAERDSSLKELSLSLYDCAIAYYRNCAVSSPGDFLAYLYRAKAYVDTGRYEEAAKLVRLLPEDAQAELQAYIDRERGGDGN